jgi:hypothetical protein
MLDGSGCPFFGYSVGNVEIETDRRDVKANTKRFATAFAAARKIFNVPSMLIA